MKALTLHQPWATLVMKGLKENETRGWKTTYRGRLAIHASQSIKFISDDEFMKRLFLTGGIGRYQISDCHYPTGVILGSVELITCEPAEDLRPWLGQAEAAFGDYSDGRWVWILGYVERVGLSPPSICRGYPGLWNVPAEVAERLRWQ